MTALADSILSQPARLRQILDLDIDQAAAALAGAQRIWLVGTGTSQHAAELGAFMLAEPRPDARWMSAASFVRFGPRLTAEDGVILISHTAETAYARSARAQALTAGAVLVPVTGEGSGWPEAITTGPRERSDTYTVSYTTALLLLARLVARLGASELTRERLAEVPDRVSRVLGEPVPTLDPFPTRVLALAGAGPAAVTAREGALKLREAARVIAEGYENEYLLHGSAVPLGAADGLLLVQPESDPDGLAGAIANAAQAEGVTVARVDEPGGLGPALTQIPLTVRLQMLASALVDRRGLDPDVVINENWLADALWERGGPDR